MNKKVILVLAILLIICLPVTALAASASKTTGDVTSTTTTATNFVLKTVTDTEASQALLENIFGLVNNDGGSPIGFFDDGVKGQIISKFPEGTDPETLQMNEFVTIEGFNYTNTIGDQPVTFSFATNYTSEQTLVAAVAIFNSDGTVAEWVVLDATVVDGKVTITFPQSILELLSSNPGALAIFSN